MVGLFFAACVLVVVSAVPVGCLWVLAALFACCAAVCCAGELRCVCCCVLLLLVAVVALDGSCVLHTQCTTLYNTPQPPSIHQWSLCVSLWQSRWSLTSFVCGLSACLRSACLPAALSVRPRSSPLSTSMVLFIVVVVVGGRVGVVLLLCCWWCSLWSLIISSSYSSR